MSKSGLWSSIFVPGIWASMTSQHAIFWPIDGVLRLGFVLARRPEITALLTALPRATMLILRVGVAQTQTFVLDLTPSAASQRKKGRIATYPLLTTWRLHSRRRGIATESTMRAGHGFGCQAVGSHGVACSGGVGGFVMPRTCLRGASRRPSLSAIGASSSQPSPTPMATGHGGWREQAP